MTFLAIAAATKARWASLWTYTTVAYDNTQFTPTANAAWVRLSVRPGDAAQVTLGPESWDRHTGITTIQIFVPLLQGLDRVAWLSDKAAAIFRKVNIPISGGSITFGVPYVVRTETGGDDWYQVNVNCPYTCDTLN